MGVNGGPVFMFQSIVLPGWASHFSGIAGIKLSQ
jgi:hypothetical protein